MNKVFFIGNLCKDPESGKTSSDISYCRFSIAVARKFSKEKDDVDFFNVVVWRGLADTCQQYLKKGSKISLVGSIEIRSYEGNDGVKKQTSEVIAEEIEFLPSSNKSATGGSSAVDDSAKPEGASAVPLEF